MSDRLHQEAPIRSSDLSYSAELENEQSSTNTIANGHGTQLLSNTVEDVPDSISVEIDPPSADPTTKELNLTDSDVKSLQALADFYQHHLENHQIYQQARARSIRETAIWSVILFVLLQTGGVAFFMRNGGLPLSDAMLFSAYTVTSAGYGSVPIPHRDGFLAFVIVYIYVGISVIAILFAQCYQYLVLESSRKKWMRDKIEGARLGLAALTKIDESVPGPNLLVRLELLRSLRRFDSKPPRGLRLRIKDFGSFVRTNEVGRALYTATLLTLMIWWLAFPVMGLEGWSYVESIYFATFSLLTIGYGNYSPQTVAGKWFVSAFLPLNVAFVALYLGGVARLYVYFSKNHVKRIEKKLHEKYLLESAKAAKDEVASSDNPQDSDQGRGDVQSAVESESMPNEAVSKSGSKSSSSAVPDSVPKSGSHSETEANNDELMSLEEGRRAGKCNCGTERRQRIHQLSNASSDLFGMESQRTTTMPDILRAACRGTEDGDPPSSNASLSSLLLSTDAETTSSWQGATSYNFSGPDVSKTPSMALRVLVQERMAQIIAADLAGTHSTSEIVDGYALLVTNDVMLNITDKWQVPRLARSVFRRVAFEALFFVGESALLNEGAAAFHKLTPAEFFNLFMPFVVALGDAEALEGWLTKTNDMAQQFIKGSPILHAEYMPRCVVQDTLNDFFPANQGNVIHLQF